MISSSGAQGSPGTALDPIRRLPSARLRAAAIHRHLLSIHQVAAFVLLSHFVPPPPSSRLARRTVVFVFIITYSAQTCSADTSTTPPDSNHCYPFLLTPYFIPSAYLQHFRNCIIEAVPPRNWVVGLQQRSKATHSLSPPQPRVISLTLRPPPRLHSIHIVSQWRKCCPHTLLHSLLERRIPATFPALSPIASPRCSEAQH
ncbi:hypothetical protein BP00DRAFT_152321 [Aspergillus indologenus CBS 114.80]|uniref:Uncharacterized protein n=1 Tax=Aspergillus indologenus CBS 114.80 TaxID=1450541 RepID=A0A2V5IQ44_9EURO|nr:hypothetical protein BP00DRAFT_152321 [Aspergillus indologenus CBS 114.80]